ncbi:MAG TPA: type II CAAX endopeptidase family protein [Sphingomicrobium sp.]|nr:type II CAAX endopeptidase family protein [Sphingomicrobium sp.]
MNVIAPSETPTRAQNALRSHELLATRIFISGQLAIFVCAAGLIVPAVTPGQAVSGGLGIKLLFLIRIAALVGLAGWMLHRRSFSWWDVGLTRPSWRRLLIAIPAGLLITMLFGILAHAIMQRAALSAPDYSMFAPIKGDLGEYLFWLLPVTLGTAAFGEELIFRGFVADALRRQFGGSGDFATVAALFGQAVIFGGLHFYQGPGGMIIAGTTGLALGITWLMAGRNLWAGIIVHALLDGYAMTAFYLGHLTR